MNPTLIAGSIVVTFALIAYSIGIITEQRKRKLTRFVLFFVTLGLFFDVTATTLMIIGSPNSPFTFHGFLGYSALAVMVADVFLMWRFAQKQKDGIRGEIPKGFHLYSRYAYSWWVIAYITGGLLVAL